jgi:hypothetical protein
VDSYYTYLIKNVDYIEDEEQPEPKVCICPDYAGTANVAYCEACADWTDNVELRAEVAYSEERAAENKLLLANFELVMAETRRALRKESK